MDDIKILLDNFSAKAHLINKNDNIYKDLIMYLGKFSENNIFSIYQDLLKKNNIEDEFNKLVIIRNGKIKTPKDEYLKNENEIIKKINENIKRDEFFKILMSN